MNSPSENANKVKPILIQPQKSHLFLITLSKFIFNKYEFLTIFLSFLSIVTYKLSLQGCEGAQVECLNKLGASFFVDLLLYAIYSAASLSLVIYFCFFKISSPYHLTYLIPIFIGLISSDLGANLSKHGSYNAIGLVVLVILFLILYFMLNLILDLFRKLYFKLSLTIILVLFILISMLTLNFSLSNCDDFYVGLGGYTMIENPNEDGCVMRRPTTCIMEIANGKLDASRSIGKKCEIRNYAKEHDTFLQFLSRDIRSAKTFGFPLSQQFPLKNQVGIAEFNTKVLDAVFDVDKGNVPEHEVELSFDSQLKGTISFNIKRNETLIKQRTIARQNNTNKVIYKNVLFIYIDAISRRHFIRKMKHTSKFIEQFLYNKTKNEKKSHKAFQYFKYNNINSYTQINVQPMFYGTPMKRNSGIHIIKYFKEKGYITGQSVNLCSREVFAVEKHFHVAQVNWEDFDHENVAMFCDTNYHHRDDPYPVTRGAFSLFRRCLYGKDTFDYVFDYTEKFWDVYSDQPKFFRAGFIDAHESTGEVVGYLDKPLATFLEKLMNKGQLTDTMIWFVSDHGNNMGEFYKLFGNDFELEKALGSLFILVPSNPGDDLKKQTGVDYNEIEKYLFENEQRLLTPYDIHDTLMDLVVYRDQETQRGINSEYGQSLFTQVDGLKRVCKKYSFDMTAEWCRCKPWDSK